MVGSSDPRAQRIVHSNRQASMRASRANFVRVLCMGKWVTVSRQWYDTHPLEWTNVEV